MSQGFDEVFDQLQTAADHTDRAERLRDAAAEEAKALVTEQLDFEADITVAEVSAPGRVTLEVHPTTLSLEDADSEIQSRVTQPMEVVVATTENPYNIDQTQDDLAQVKKLILALQSEHEEGARIEDVYTHATELGFSETVVEQNLEKLRQKGEVYEPQNGHLRGV